jgi:hypothetical protein
LFGARPGRFTLPRQKRILFAEKANTRVYHKTDTRWNERGAFFAYQKIMQRLSQDLPEILPKTLADFNPSEEIAGGKILPT